MLLAISLVAGVALAEPAIHLRKFSKIETTGAVLLRDVAEITDLDDNANTEVGKIEITEIPGNATRNLTGFQISKILRRYLPGIEEKLGQKITVVVPPVVRIQNKIFRLDSEAVTLKIEGEFKKICNECEYRLSNLVIPDIHNIHSGANWSLEYQGVKLPRGNFSIPLRVENKTIWISGSVKVMKKVPVAIRNLNIGERISEVDFKYELKDITQASDGFPESTKLIGRQISRGVSANDSISYSNLAKEVAVRFGQPVKIVNKNEWLEITMNGIAQEKGDVGDRIKVLNPSTKTILSAVIEAPSIVRIQ
ncbi:MAG: hypothetical protein A4S09_00855 [Proteobacteria bacterium SG_bin7]|nr:MAG: hypothetical protein A4S09_00855 [Proteobacteria bacterium SG_bin7]